MAFNISLYFFGTALNFGCVVIPESWLLVLILYDASAGVCSVTESLLGNLRCCAAKTKVYRNPAAINSDVPESSWNPKLFHRNLKKEVPSWNSIWVSMERVHLLILRVLTTLFSSKWKQPIRGAINVLKLQFQLSLKPIWRVWSISIYIVSPIESF